jgi:muramoyltetrapeptide carboxypeptidase
MHSNKRQAEYLKYGDEVAIISPSFSIDKNVIHEAVTILENWGLRVRIGDNAFNQNGPFAGSDKERLSDLQLMTDDKEIKAVICSRGGYGLSRIINKVDFSALKENPKWFVGYSDITVLHIWLNEVCGIISVHSEMPVNFNNTKKTRRTMSSLQQALFGDLKSCEWEGSFLKADNISGEIIGGNLSLLCGLVGSQADPVTKGKILFIEDVGEYFYRIDRMLTSLKLAGKLEGLSALLIGGMNNIEDGSVPWGMSIEETISGIVSEYDYPLFFNFPAGHTDDNHALYIGRHAKIEVKGKKVNLTFV